MLRTETENTYPPDPSIKEKECDSTLEKCQGLTTWPPQTTTI